MSEPVADQVIGKINALVHRDYSRLGAVHVRLAGDGLTLSSQAGFVEGITLHNLLVAAPRCRNPPLADIVQRIGLAERTGRGIDRIYGGMLRYGRPAPDYEMLDGDSVGLMLPDQAAEYDKKRMTVRQALPLQLFVSDEASAIQWLKQQLTKKPQTFQDIHRQFTKKIGGWQKHEKAMELSELIEQNFLLYDGTAEAPSQIHSYLSSNLKELCKLVKDDPALKTKGKDRWYVPAPNKADDLEKLRERALMREFEEYLPAPRASRQAGRESEQKRLRVFRFEAVRAGFKKAWQERDYATIIALARKIQEKVLHEDAKLLLWHDQAVTRMGGE